MSQHAMYMALLRPPVLHILRAAGFHAARPAALDSLVDLAARYLLVVATKTSETSHITHNGGVPTVTDVRLALEDVGAFRPQISDIEGQMYGDDDLRGIEAFVQWTTGSANKEIRRIAGLVAAGELPEVEAAQEKEDFLAALKKKHSKTGEESRFQGTMLGKDVEEHLVQIDGGLDSIHAWEAQRHQASKNSRPPSVRSSSAPLSVVSSPLSDV